MRESGRRLRDRYEVVEELGRGGEGRVLRAHDHHHHRDVALKIRPVPSGRARRAALDEARTLLAVPPHPGIALLRDDFFEDGQHIVVMDHIPGEDLATVLAREGAPGLAAERVGAWISQVADALDHLHRCEPPIVHGDVKPANIVLSARGAVLVDFGLAGSGPGRGATHRYAAPEQARGERSTAADVFSLAATAYELLTGSTPVPGTTPTWDSVPEGSRRAVAAVFVGGLAFDPRQRPGARAFATSLATALDPEGLTDPAGIAAAPAFHPAQLATTVLDLPHRRRHRRWLAIGIAAVVFADVAAAASGAADDGGRPGEDRVATVGPSSAPTSPSPASTPVTWPSTSTRRSRCRRSRSARRASTSRSASAPACTATSPSATTRPASAGWSTAAVPAASCTACSSPTATPTGTTRRRSSSRAGRRSRRRWASSSPGPGCRARSRPASAWT